MFPLAGKTFPQSADELARSIRDALAEVLTLPGKQSPVTIDAPGYPTVKRLVVNLDGATVKSAEPPPKPTPTGKREPGVRVGQLEVSGRPIRYEKSKVDFHVSGKDVTFEFGRDKDGKPLAILTDAASGDVDVNVAKADLQALALALAGAAAKQQGVTIQELNVNLTSAGPRSVAADVRVKAKKMMMSGVLHVKGKLDVDDALNAKVSDLSCTGEGMIGTMAAGMVQGLLQRYNNTQVPLSAFSLGDVALHDLQIDTSDGLHVTAQFGKGK